MSLKTLRDLECEIYAANGFSDVVCTSKDLRQEAIKLMKLFPSQKAKLITKTPKILLNEILGEDIAIIKAFMYFFNIEESDLK